MLACSGHKSITFVGDSRMRNLYFAFAAATDPNFDSSEQEGKTHADLSTIIPNLAIQIEFIWAPALDDGAFLRWLPGLNRGSHSFIYLAYCSCAAGWAVLTFLMRQEGGNGKGK